MAVIAFSQSSTPTLEDHSMKTLTVFLIAAALSALECEAVVAASQPIDPDHAPIAAVDRYSDEAGTLLRR